MIVSKFGPSLSPRELAHGPKPGRPVRAQTSPCALVCAAHTFILVLLFKTLRKKKKSKEPTIYVAYVHYIYIKYGKDNNQDPPPQRCLALAFAPPGPDSFTLNRQKETGRQSQAAGLDPGQGVGAVAGQLVRFYLVS